MDIHDTHKHKNARYWLKRRPRPGSAGKTASGSIFGAKIVKAAFNPKRVRTRQRRWGIGMIFPAYRCGMCARIAASSSAAIAAGFLSNPIGDPGENPGEGIVAYSERR